MAAQHDLDARHKPSRIYHSHSRSRQLLALPLSVPRQKRHAARSAFPKLAISLFVAFAIFLVLDRATPAHVLSVAGVPNTRGPVVVQRPPLIRGGDASAATPVTAHEATPPTPALPFQHARADRPVAAPPAAEARQPAAHVASETAERPSLPPGQVGNPASVEHPPVEEGPRTVSKEAVAADKSVDDAPPGEKEPPPKPAEAMFRDPADFSSFDENTALNYFHLHKTGGVSFKERLFDFFILEEKKNRRGVKAKVVDTCHMSGPARPALGIEAQWSCDWGEIEVMPEKERNKIDVVVGHQYWERGAGYWVPNRDLRYFTVMRHPLHRKVSFFYHFFVRNAGRSEDDVSASEVIEFVLGRDMPSSPLVRDAGPGYYASRLWSDGMLGYGDFNKFEIPDGKASTMVFNSIRRLRKNFVFIGLQTQEKASLCMLKKTVHEFAKAHGFENMKGLDDLAQPRERMNTGSYSLSGKLLWEKMTEGQREEFKRVERVDLAIYRESVKMFHEMAKRFSCGHLVVDSADDSIALF